MNLVRKYIQFNDLVIDNKEMLSEATLSGGFKTETQEYSFRHGSYVPFKNKQQYAREQSLSITFNIDYRKLRKEQVRFYKDYIYLNIVKPGKLWAVEGNNLIWSNAFVSDFSQIYMTERNVFSIDVDFVIYDGIWHKADVRRVFLQPYYTCDFAEYFGFKEVNECVDCCTDCNSGYHEPCPKCIDECEFLNADNSLCEMKKDALEAFYSQCGETFMIIYNCSAGAKIWGEESMLGHKICKSDPNNYSLGGQFYSDTVIDSDNLVVTLTGSWKNPIITINKNSMQILGEYNGTLTVTNDGKIYYLEKEGCKELEIDINNLVILDNFGWLVHNGMNSVYVEGACCSYGCIYIKVDSLTI